MKTFAVSTALVASLLASQMAPVTAAEYTQFYKIPGLSSSYTYTPVYRAPNSYIAQATVSDSTAVQSPQVILNRLLAANNVPAEIKPTLSIEESKSLNAATDGQKILITTALLDRLNTTDQRAFVISHELSHILLQHIGKTQVRRIGLSLLDAFLIRRYTEPGSLAELASRLGIGLVDKKSARGLEFQADDLGIRLMSQAGYNPQAAIQVFNILQAATPGNNMPEFLQSHPISESRIKALAEKYKLSIQ